MTEQVVTRRDLFRLRVCYAKQDRLRHLAHLEVLGTIDRCIRRASLPFSVSNGFSPRMRVQFSSALPVGDSSQGEWYDLYLRELVDVDEAFKRIYDATPADLRPLRAGYVSSELPALEAWLVRSSWQLELCGSEQKSLLFSSEDLRNVLNQLACQGQLSYMRKDKCKQVDLTKTLVGFQVEETSDALVVQLETRATPTGSLRPSILLQAAFSELGVDASRVAIRVCRCGQWGENENGELLDPLTTEVVA